MPDLMKILANFSSQIAPLIMLMQTVAMLMGLYLVAGALTEMWGVTNDNALRYLGGKSRFSAGSAIVQLLIGGVLCAMGTLEMVGILSRTLTEDFASSRFLSYTPTNNSFNEQKAAAMSALLGIMQVVGFIAMIKGWMTLNRHANGQAQAGIGTATAWLIGGVLAWNFKWFTDLLNCTLGYNVIGMFVPFATTNSCS
jgi:intracellular multiplication protein IcmC